MLTDAEQELLRATSDRKLAKLDEDELIDLHTRVAERGPPAPGRGTGRLRPVPYPGVQRGAPHGGEGEAFEEALATVSDRLGKVAAEQARLLKEERLAAAARSDRPRDRPTAGKARRPAGGAPRSRGRAPIDEKRTASARAPRSACAAPQHLSPA